MALYSRTRPSPLKYRNTPVVVDGIRFSSKAEARHYGDLKLLERAGEISSLECQPRFPLTVNGQLFATYVADFGYQEKTPAGPRHVVVDVKSPPTKTPIWRLKWKLAKALYPSIDFREAA